MKNINERDQSKGYIPLRLIIRDYMIEINTQSSIKIDNIYFDPYLIKDEMHDAKIIFITHSHYDHFDINSINNIRNDDTYIVIPDDKDILDVLDFSEDKILIVKPNNKYNLFSYFD